MTRNRFSTGRRNLLRGLGALPSLAWLAACDQSQAQAAIVKPIRPGDTVLIVGAGMAGLTAANALNRVGIRNIVIEARDRIGGRLHTVDVGGIPIDLGASWIHDPDGGNPMTAFADAAGVGYTPADPTSDAATINYFDSRTGTNLQTDLIAAFVNYNLFNQTESQWLGMLNSRASYKDGVELFLDSQPLLLLPDQRRRSEQFIQFLFEAFDSGPWDQASLFYDVNSPINTYSGSEFGNFPTGGYSRLARAMAASSDIRLEQQVTRIQVRDDGVTVFATNTAGGASTPVQFTGSHVIVTLPLGVLKAGSVAFDPPLPPSRQSSIARVGFGHFEKVAMRFPTPFWQAGLLPKTHLYYVTKNSTYPTEYAFFLDYQRFIGQPALVAIAAAEFAEAAAQKTPQENLARVMEILREVYGPSTPDPLDYAVSSWATDAFSMGSYSELPVGATPADMDELGTPIGGRMLFAGEATNKERYGYADGALSSGLREARRLITNDYAFVTPGPA